MRREFTKFFYGLLIALSVLVLYSTRIPKRQPDARAKFKEVSALLKADFSATDAQE